MNAPLICAIDQDTNDYVRDERVSGFVAVIERPTGWYTTAARYLGHEPEARHLLVDSGPFATRTTARTIGIEALEAWRFANGLSLRLRLVVFLKEAQPEGRLRALRGRYHQYGLTWYQRGGASGLDYDYYVFEGFEALRQTVKVASDIEQDFDDIVLTTRVTSNTRAAGNDPFAVPPPSNSCSCPHCGKPITLTKEPS